MHSTRNQEGGRRQWQSLSEAVAAYVKNFGVGPPIFGMEEVEALDAIDQALASGQPINHGAERHIPKGALL